MISAYVKGLGVWTGDLPPPCKIVDSRLGRGTSHATRMAIDCAAQASQHAGFDLTQLAAVFGSALGEIEIAIEQLAMMLSEEGIVSPARFKNSVHNTASGVLSIASKNRGFTSAIAAGDHTLPATLLETMLLLETGKATQAIAVVADEATPEPLRSARRDNEYAALGAAFALDRSPERALAKLTLAQNADGEPLSIPTPFEFNPCAAGLALHALVEAHQSGTYVLSSPPLGQGWSVRLECSR